ncbi:MAG TPA: SH3 domain-containing protein [Polyangiaceae bacterium]
MKVEVPEPGADRPELGRVGVIAGVGFAIGIAWPWLAGVRLVPSPPTDEAAEAAPSASAAGPSASGDPAALAPSGAPGASGTPAPEAPVRTREETVKVSDMKITACRDGKKKLKDCDRVGFDSVARPHLVALAGCAAAGGASETLSLGFELDFEKKLVSDVFAGKSTTFAKDKAHALVDCARKEFESVRLDGVDHEHASYTAFSFIEFVPPGTVTAPAAGLGGDSPAAETTEASGLATIGWDVAVVRDQPEDGKILTRLRYGTRVAVTAHRGKWYEVRYDAKGAKGWVHRNALGL